jgi:hypothetical protein
VDDAEREPAKAGLAETEGQHGGGVLGGLGGDHDPAADAPRVPGPVHHNRTRGVSNHGETYRAEQVTAEGSSPPRPENHEVSGRGQLDQERPRIRNLEQPVDLDVRRGEA